MTQIYRVVGEPDAQQCYLFVSEAPHHPGLFVASVLYWSRRNEETGNEEIGPETKHFPSTKSSDDAKDLAEKWVKENLFADYTITVFDGS